MSPYRVTRVRRDAIPRELDATLSFAYVGQRARITFYGVPSEVVITALTPEWVEFRTPEEDPS